MMRLAAVLILLVSSVSYADDVCNEIPKLKLKMSVHASNWANAKTTRTPAGGAYQYKLISCNKTCTVLQESRLISTYKPNHPDANKNGYVNYPKIDKAIERAAISTYAHAMVLLKKQCKNQIKVFNNKDSAIVKYTPLSEGVDIFNFDSNKKIISWVSSRSGMPDKILNF